MSVNVRGQTLPGRAGTRATLQRAARHPRLTLLGGFALTQGSRHAPLATSAARVVAFTALSPPAAKRTEIATALWGHLPPARARANLRSALSRLRSSAPRLLTADPTFVQLAPEVAVDAWELEARAKQILQEGAPAIATEVGPDGSFTAELLPEWDDDWVVLERDRLRDLGMRALERQASGLVAMGESAGAVQSLYAVLRADPLRESALRALVDLHLNEGNQAEAVRVFAGFRQRLRRELNTEPSEALLAAMSRVRLRGGQALLTS